jgi:hypothetical protein
VSAGVAVGARHRGRTSAARFPRGCKHLCAQDPAAEGQDAHHTRLLLALDLSIAAACRSRGIPACNGQDAADPHATDGCEIGRLHTRAAELAIALAAMIEDHNQGFRAARALGDLSADSPR